MADDRMALLALAEKHADGDFLRELGQYVLQRLMELEAQQRCGAGVHERSAERVNQRNGYREREFDTRIGAMQLRIPPLPWSTLSPPFPLPRSARDRFQSARAGRCRPGDTGESHESPGRGRTRMR